MSKNVQSQGKAKVWKIVFFQYEGHTTACKIRAILLNNSNIYPIEKLLAY